MEECSATSAGNHEWFTEMFLQQEKEEAKRLGMNVYQYTDRLAAEVGPADQNIIFLPFLYGSNYDPRAKACFVGLDSTIPAPRSSGRCWRAWCSATWFTLKSCCCT